VIEIGKAQEVAEHPTFLGTGHSSITAVLALIHLDPILPNEQSQKLHLF